VRPSEILLLTVTNKELVEERAAVLDMIKA
jgi:hypothetical protein